MNKYAIILILAVSILSCKNTKQVVKTDTEVKTSTETEVAKIEETKADTKVVKAVAENVTETDNSIIEEIVTELSKPDNTGKQYTEKITKKVIKIGKNKETKVNENTEVNQAVENKVTETEIKAEDKNETTETDIKTVKKSQSWKVIGLIVFVLVAVGFIVYKLKGTAIKTAFKKLIK